MSYAKAKQSSSSITSTTTTSNNGNSRSAAVFSPSSSKMRDHNVHWSHRITEAVILAHPDGSLGLTIKGGADFGEFPYLGELKQERIRYQNLSGGDSAEDCRVYQGDLILEVQGQSVAGFTQRDVVLWLKHCSRNQNPVVLKCVQSGSHSLTKDLKEYLAGGHAKGSLDHELQTAIRDNLYMRTVPCTTREQKPEEVDGQDYWFLSKEAFLDLEKDGHLLESGLFGGNFYGTPKPPHEPMEKGPERSITELIIRPGGHPSSEGKRRRNRSNVEALSSPAGTPQHHNASESTENLLTVLAHKQRTNGAREHGDNGDIVDNAGAGSTRPGDQDEDNPADQQQHHFVAPQMKQDGGFWKDIASQAMAKARHHDSGHQSEEEPVRHTEDDYLLPYGWEKVDDPVYGTYYIDHVNKKTQYDHPHPQPASRVEEPPTSASTYNSSTFPRIKKRVPGSPDGGGGAANTSSSRLPKSASSTNAPLNGQKSSSSRHIWTADSLRGEFLDVVLIKSSQGLGFTVIGGEPQFPNADFEDEDTAAAGAGTLLQLKSIAPNGPAHVDGRLRPGDVLVTINERSVLGYTHDQVIHLFQGIYPGDQVRMRVCRGYDLPQDATDPRAQVITTDAVSSSGAGNTNSLGRNKPRAYILPRQTVSVSAIDTNDQEVADAFDEQQSAPSGPLYRVNIAKGASGFGFNVLESPDGQVIRKITDKKKCQGLMEGDLLVEINGINVRGLDHKGVVDVLKNSPADIPSVFLVQRATRIEGRKEQRSSRFTGRSKTPTADMYKSQNSEPAQPKKQRSKTPTPRSSSSLFGFFRSKTPKPSKEISNETTTVTNTSTTYASQPRNGEISVMKTQRARTPEFKATSPAPVQPAVSDFKRNQFAYSSMTRMVTPSYIPASQYVKKTEENQRNQPIIHESRQDWQQQPLPDRRMNEVGYTQADLGNRPSALKVNNGYENSSLISIPSSSIMEGDNESQLHSPPGSLDLVVALRRDEAGFGFRIVGGTEEGSQVSVGFIVPGGAAERDGRLEVGDEILNIDGMSVIGSEHRQVIQMMQRSSSNGNVVLGVRRKINYLASHTPRQVVIRRQPTEGFGFVIISSMARNQQNGGNSAGLNGMQTNYPILGRILENSPAERSLELHVGDKILAVNGVDVLHLHHSEIVQMIKESGNAVTLTILPQAAGVPDDASTISASSQQRYDDANMHHPDSENTYAPQQSNTRTTERFEFYAIQLDRGTRGFGFSIRGGKEFHSMPLFVLRIADNGPAAMDGRLRVGDEIIEINGVNTKDFTHGEAIELIKQGGTYVRLLIKRAAPSGLTSPTRGVSSASLPLSPSNQSVQYSSNRQYLDGGVNAADRYAATSSPTYLTYASPSSLNYGQDYGSSAFPTTQSFPPVNGQSQQSYQPFQIQSANAMPSRRPYQYTNNN
ncbi:Membrane-associated guanylate kinase, WW and PDZ domain-containing protein 2 [Hypsibius exemplaris]|uniref:Membrane-associated guanylate kinase, WW and PDZ domain-containing protein 2 n=1 Tax=Hypsibius exemplaris TaxID=2072580 RepID=A0A1W0X1B2_HYPEX|nr:Membrane-associated guanylate kinase, WW and PDZ domain-containing protein 2 [Hypsibius exemplaris]